MNHPKSMFQLSGGHYRPSEAMIGYLIGVGLIGTFSALVINTRIGLEADDGDPNRCQAFGFRGFCVWGFRASEFGVQGLRALGCKAQLGIWGLRLYGCTRGIFIVQLGIGSLEFCGRGTQMEEVLLLSRLLDFDDQWFSRFLHPTAFLLGGPWHLITRGIMKVTILGSSIREAP